MHIEPRSAWGAAPPKAPGRSWAPSGPIDLVVHWVGGSGSIGITSHADCPPRIKAIQTYEMSKEYSDIAYNLVCCPHGTVYEGRGLNVQGAANGPQTNATKPSVCLLLNMADRITSAMQASILELNATLTPGTILGHREVNTTTCPGNEVYAWITNHRHANPIPPVPAPGPIGDQMPILMRGDKTPEVWLVNGNTRLWLDQNSYGPWKLWLVAHAPGSTDPKTNAEWVVPQVMIDRLVRIGQ